MVGLYVGLYIVGAPNLGSINSAGDVTVKAAH